MLNPQVQPAPVLLLLEGAKCFPYVKQPACRSLEVRLEERLGWNPTRDILEGKHSGSATRRPSFNPGYLLPKVTGPLWCARPPPYRELLMEQMRLTFGPSTQFSVSQLHTWIWEGIYQKSG